MVPLTSNFKRSQSLRLLKTSKLKKEIEQRRKHVTLEEVELSSKLNDDSEDAVEKDRFFTNLRCSRMEKYEVPQEIKLHNLKECSEVKQKMFNLAPKRTNLIDLNEELNSSDKDEELSPVHNKSSDGKRSQSMPVSKHTQLTEDKGQQQKCVTLKEDEPWSSPFKRFASYVKRNLSKTSPTEDKKNFSEDKESVVDEKMFNLAQKRTNLIDLNEELNSSDKDEEFSPVHNKSSDGKRSQSMPVLKHTQLTEDKGQQQKCVTLKEDEPLSSPFKRFASYVKRNLSKTSPREDGKNFSEDKESVVDEKMFNLAQKRTNLIDLNEELNSLDKDEELSPVHNKSSDGKRSQSMPVLKHTQLTEDKGQQQKCVSLKEDEPLSSPFKRFASYVKRNLSKTSPREDGKNFSEDKEGVMDEKMFNLAPKGTKLIDPNEELNSPDKDVDFSPGYIKSWNLQSSQLMRVSKQTQPTEDIGQQKRCVTLKQDEPWSSPFKRFAKRNPSQTSPNGDEKNFSEDKEGVMDEKMFNLAPKGTKLIDPNEELNSPDKDVDFSPGYIKSWNLQSSQLMRVSKQTQPTEDIGQQKRCVTLKQDEPWSSPFKRFAKRNPSQTSPNGDEKEIGQQNRCVTLKQDEPWSSPFKRFAKRNPSQTSPRQDEKNFSEDKEGVMDEKMFNLAPKGTKLIDPNEELNSPDKDVDFSPGYIKSWNLQSSQLMRVSKQTQPTEDIGQQKRCVTLKQDEPWSSPFKRFAKRNPSQTSPNGDEKNFSEDKEGVMDEKMFNLAPKGTKLIDPNEELNSPDKDVDFSPGYIKSWNLQSSQLMRVSKQTQPTEDIGQQKRCVTLKQDEPWSSPFKRFAKRNPSQTSPNGDEKNFSEDKEGVMDEKMFNLAPKGTKLIDPNEELNSPDKDVDFSPGYIKSWNLQSSQLMRVSKQTQPTEDIGQQKRCVTLKQDEPWSSPFKRFAKRNPSQTSPSGDEKNFSEDKEGVMDEKMFNLAPKGTKLIDPNEELNSPDKDVDFSPGYIKSWNLQSSQLMRVSKQTQPTEDIGQQKRCVTLKQDEPWSSPFKRFAKRNPSQTSPNGDEKNFSEDKEGVMDEKMFNLAPKGTKLIDPNEELNSPDKDVDFSPGYIKSWNLQSSQLMRVSKQTQPTEEIGQQKRCVTLKQDEPWSSPFKRFAKRNPSQTSPSGDEKGFVKSRIGIKGKEWSDLCHDEKSKLDTVERIFTKKVKESQLQMEKPTSLTRSQSMRILKQRKT
ncbi:hypothetical protein KUTeg_013657 [Tegillarca granosa]|uniref:Tankyrase 1-binding protein C-terminal domain-containing protein n=1 Tax=Tegillarca granosa TaxID=220873 RepID=A0ABQ9EUC0_TEGGR|nr:hypothetical protein KUTeg_013657 [Tegillarca granosa]